MNTRRCMAVRLAALLVFLGSSTGFGTAPPVCNPNESDLGGNISVSPTILCVNGIANGTVEWFCPGDDCGCAVVLYSDNTTVLQIIGGFTSSSDCSSGTPPPSFTVKGVGPGTANLVLKLVVTKSDGSQVTKVVSKTFTVLKVELRELSFTNNFTIKSDSGAVDYTQPHWQDPNGDGDASDGHAYPLCFTRNTKMKLTAGKWYIQPANPPVTIKIKGDGPGNLDFPETTATVSGNDVTISDVECSANFANEIDFFDPLSVDWKASIDGGSSWFTAGRSTNQTYVILGNPSTNVPLYHTLLHVGCKNADGETTADGAVAAIWPDFEDRIVKRVDGQTLYYYSNAVPTSSATDLAGLLATADGQCTAWADFFNGILLVQGITDGGVQVASPWGVALWDANDATNATVTNVVFGLHDGGILVKHWSLLNASWATNDTNHNCIPDSIETEFPDVFENWSAGEPGVTQVNDDFLMPYHDVLPPGSYEGLSDIKTTGTGLKGQGDIVPSVQMFGQHFIVTRGDPYTIPAQSYTIYDPSYGKKYEGVHAVNQWTTNALDGFYQVWEGTPNSFLDAAPNDGNCLIKPRLVPEANYLVF